MGRCFRALFKAIKDFDFVLRKDEKPLSFMQKNDGITLVSMLTEWDRMVGKDVRPIRAHYNYSLKEDLAGEVLFYLF